MSDRSRREEAVPPQPAGRRPRPRRDLAPLLLEAHDPDVKRSPSRTSRCLRTSDPRASSSRRAATQRRRAPARASPGPRDSCGARSAAAADCATRRSSSSSRTCLSNRARASRSSSRKCFRRRPKAKTVVRSPDPFRRGFLFSSTSPPASLPTTSSSGSGRPLAPAGRAQRDPRPDGHRTSSSSARARPRGSRAFSRSWTSRTKDSSSSGARRRLSIGRESRRPPTGTRPDPPRRDRGGRGPSAAISSSRLPRTPRRSRRAQVLRDGAEGRERAPVAEESPRGGAPVQGAIGGPPALHDLVLLRNVHSVDRERARRDARMRSPPGVAPPVRIGDFHVADAVPLGRFEEMTPADRLASPHAVPLSRVNFPFERVRLASLETWKIRKGQSIPARGVAREATGWPWWGPPTNWLPSARSARSAPRDRSHPAKLVLAE